MAVTRKRIEKNLQIIRETIASACDRARRDPEDISIVAVTKSVETETIRHVLDAGLLDIAESRAQQLTSRAEEIAGYLQRRRQPLDGEVRWHMVGHLQRNKVKGVLDIGAVVHSVDSLRLAEELSSRAAKDERTAEVFLQVNCSKEEQKYGVAVGAAVHLAEMMTSLPNLRLLGLMTMGPVEQDPQATRNAFIRLRELFEEMRTEKIGGDDFRHLSMGMSGDYPLAVEEGATLLRIGTALFE
jgi:PLP dependent protein